MLRKIRNLLTFPRLSVVDTGIPLSVSRKQEIFTTIGREKTSSLIKKRVKPTFHEIPTLKLPVFCVAPGKTVGPEKSFEPFFTIDGENRKGTRRP